MILFEKKEITKHIDRIKTPFGVSVYYVQGDNFDLLIDTGMGVGSLKTFIENNYCKPYTVALTHGHCDHAGGSYEFTEVFLNEKDWDLEKTHATLEHRIRDVFHAPFGTPEGTEESMFLPQRKDKFIKLTDYQEFDLGGVHIKWIPLPGHTHGCMVPIVLEDKIAIIGDSLGEMTLLHFPESTSIEEYKKSLINLSQYEHLFNRCLRFHGTGESDKKIITDTIDLCDEILNHKDAAIPIEMMDYNGYIARKKEHPGYAGNVVYNPNKIKDDTND